MHLLSTTKNGRFAAEFLMILENHCAYLKMRDLIGFV